MSRSPRTSLPARPLIGLGLGLALALMTAATAACDDEWRCGYGGPGCGPPGLLGLCEATVLVDAETEVTAVYYDDTGAHPAAVRSAASDDPALVVEFGDAEGALRLRGDHVGAALLTLEVDGWGAPQTWTIAVQEPSGDPPEDCARESVRADD